MSLELSARIDAALQSPTVDLLVALLKAAREATDDVPIVKQILGAVVHIIEYAEKMRANRDAMRSLAEKAATFAQQIQQIVEGCAVNDRLQARLQRLYTVFNDIESFARAESAVQGRFKRTLRTCFIVPRQIERLGGDLDNGIQAFLMTTTLEMTLRQEDEAKYIGGLRRLRQCDVHTLEILHTLHHRGATVQYSKARVDSEVVLVRHVKRVDERVIASAGVDVAATEDETFAPDSDDRLIDLLTNAPLSHPHVVQFVGRSRSSGPVFTSLRCGSYSVWDLCHYVRTLPDGELRQRGAADMVDIILKVIDAAAYLKIDLNIIWCPTLDDGLMDEIVIDCNGQPSIGFVEHLTRDQAHTDKAYGDIVSRVVGDLANSLPWRLGYSFVGTIGNHEDYNGLLYALQYPQISGGNTAWNTAVSRLLEEQLCISTGTTYGPRFLTSRPMLSERAKEYIDEARLIWSHWVPSIELVCGPYPGLSPHWRFHLHMEHILRQSDREEWQQLYIKMDYRSDDSLGQRSYSIEIPERLLEEFRVAVYGTDPMPPYPGESPAHMYPSFHPMTLVDIWEE